MAAVSTEITQNVTKMYNAKQAEMYNEIMKSEMEAEFTVGPLRKIAAMAENVDGLVCDAACGCGHMVEWFITHAKGGKNADRKFVANDLAPDMLKATEERLKEHVSSGRVKLTEGSMTQLTAVADASCAAVMNCYSIHHVAIDDVRATLAEAFRVLTPGGAMLLEWWEGEGEMAVPEGEHYFGLHNLYTVAAIRELATAAGFDDGASSVEKVVHEEFGMTMGFAYLTKPKAA